MGDDPSGSSFLVRGEEQIDLVFLLWDCEILQLFTSYTPLPATSASSLYVNSVRSCTQGSELRMWISTSGNAPGKEGDRNRT
jgi:hypothetical protein